MRTNKVKKTLAIQKQAVTALQRIVTNLTEKDFPASALYEGDLISMLTLRSDAETYIEEQLARREQYLQ